MARTPYATEIHNTSQKSARVPSAGQPTFIVIHHAATMSFDAVVQMELGTKQVSSTVVIKDGRVASMFDEAYRAWSLSSQYWDSVSLSSETCNSGGAADGWPISEASYVTLARVVADWCRRYGIPCNRERIMGHREVYTRYGASYATACPGGINLDRIVVMAAALLAGTAGGDSKPIELPKEDDDMIVYVSTTESDDKVIPKGFSFIQGTDGILRPLSQAEYNVYDFYAGHGIPYRKAVWSGNDIRAVSRTTGIREWDGAPNNAPLLTGKVFYADPAQADYPRVSAG